MLADILHKVAQILYEDRQPYHPRPSLCSPEFEDAPGRCIRQMVYHRLNVPARPLPGRAVLVFDDGHWHEDASAQWIAKTAIRLHDRQMPVDIPLPFPIGSGYPCHVCTPARPIPSTMVHGHIDGLLTDPCAVTRLWEHKAINHFAFQEALDGALPLDYIAQGCAYLAGLQQTHPDITECLLLLKSKNTAAYLEYRFRYEPATDRCSLIEMVASNGTSGDLTTEILEGLLTSAYAKFAAVESLAAQCVFPPRPYRCDSWRCSYCLWGETCWEGYEAEVQAREPIAQLPELAAMLQKYQDASQAKRDGERTTKALRPRILAALEAANTTCATANGLVAKVSTQTRTLLDQELLPAPIRKAATYTKTIETLDVVTALKDVRDSSGRQQVQAGMPQAEAQLIPQPV